MSQMIADGRPEHLTARQDAHRANICICAHPRHLRTGLVAALLFAAAVPLIADDHEQEAEEFNPPGLMATSPAGLRPGRPTELRLRGEHLEAATGLWTSFDADVEVVEAQPNVARFRLTLHAGAQVGIGAVRVITDRGMSPPALVMIDDLPTEWEGGDNHSPADARPLTPPVAVAGHVPPRRSRFYRVTAEAGDSLSIDVVAQRIGSPLDPLVRVLDADTRRVVAYSDHEPGLRGDARLTCTFPSSGDYLIELRHVEHAGGGDDRYRMRIGRFPLASAPLPLAARPGETVELRIAGPAVEDVAPVEVYVPEDAKGRLSVSVRYSGGSGGEGSGGGEPSGFVELMVSSIDELTVPPRDTSGGGDGPLAINPPVGVNALLAAPGDRHVYEFEAAEGDRLHITGHTDSLGSPARLYMELHHADGERIARTADLGTPGGDFTHTVEADGTYRLFVEDLHRRGGPEYAYRVVVVTDAPLFTLSAHEHTIDAPAGGEAAVNVTAHRDGYDGPITLSLQPWPGTDDDDPPAIEDNVIGEGETEVELKITPDDDADPGRWYILRIVGTAEIDDREHTALADTRPALADRWNALRHHPPAILEGQFVLNILPPEPDPEPEPDEEPDDADEPEDEEDDEREDNEDDERDPDDEDDADDDDNEDERR